jgi:hypothetical protein
MDDFQILTARMRPRYLFERCMPGIWPPSKQGASVGWADACQVT